jgi:hypothetical protein
VIKLNINQPNLYIGTFDAEKYWRDVNLAVLPSIKDPNSEVIVGVLDELLFTFCDKDQDFLFTRYKIDNIQMDYLKELGFSFKNIYLYNNEYLTNKSSDNICSLLLCLENFDYLKAEIKNLKFSPYAIDEFSSLFCRKYGLYYEIPDFEIVKNINSKFFSFEMMRNIHPSYTGKLVDSSDSLLAIGKYILKSSGSFLLKDVYGVSGKGNLLIESEGVLNNIFRFLLKQEKSGKEVRFIAEPFYKKDIDFSCQFEVLENGDIEYRSIQVMQNKAFAFAGIQEANKKFYNFLQKNGYYDYIEPVINEMYKLGYFGPVCIDSMTLKDKSIIPIIEINARKSMGFINTSFKKKINNNAETFLMTYSLGIPDNITYEFFFNSLKSHDILYYPNKENGIVPLTSTAFGINCTSATDHIYRGRLNVEYVFNNESIKDILMTKLENLFSELHIHNYK